MSTASDMEELQFRTVYTHRGCSSQVRPFRHAAADSPAQNVKFIGPELIVVDFPNGFFDFIHNRCRQLVLAKFGSSGLPDYARRRMWELKTEALQVRKSRMNCE